MIKKILVSQPEPSSSKSPYYDIEKDCGVKFTFYPLIRVERLSAREFREQKINILDYTAIVFNSRHAVDHFFNLCKDLRVSIPEDMKYFAISEMVALYIQKYVQYRKRKVFFSKSGKWPELITTMVKHKSEKYLVPQSSVHTNELPEMLREAKLDYVIAVMYRTVTNALPSDHAFDYEMVVLFTPTGIQALLDSVPGFEQGDIRLCAFGKSTAQAIKDAGFRLDLEAPTPQAPSITSAIEMYLKNNQ